MIREKREERSENRTDSKEERQSITYRRETAEENQEKREARRGK